MYRNNTRQSDIHLTAVWEIWSVITLLGLHCFGQPMRCIFGVYLKGHFHPKFNCIYLAINTNKWELYYAWLFSKWKNKGIYRTWPSVILVMCLEYICVALSGSCYLFFHLNLLIHATSFISLTYTLGSLELFSRWWHTAQMVLGLYQHEYFLITSAFPTGKHICSRKTFGILE